MPTNPSHCPLCTNLTHQVSALNLPRFFKHYIYLRIKMNLTFIFQVTSKNLLSCCIHYFLTIIFNCPPPSTDYHSKAGSLHNFSRKTWAGAKLLQLKLAFSISVPRMAECSKYTQFVASVRSKRQKPPLKSYPFPTLAPLHHSRRSHPNDREYRHRTDHSTIKCFALPPH